MSIHRYLCRLNNDRTGLIMDWDHPEILSAISHKAAAMLYAKKDKDEFRGDLCTKVLVRDLETDKQQVFHIERNVKVTWSCDDATEDYSHEGVFFLDNEGQVIPENTYDD